MGVDAGIKDICSPLVARNPIGATPIAAAAPLPPPVLAATVIEKVQPLGGVKLYVPAFAGVPPAVNIKVCGPATVQLNSTEINGATYQWTPVTGLSDPGIASPMATVKETTLR